MSDYAKGARTSLRVATAIETMREALRDEYGQDYSFQIAGHGQSLAASNLVYGEVFSDYYQDSEDAENVTPRGVTKCALPCDPTTCGSVHTCGASEDAS